MTMAYSIRQQRPPVDKEERNAEEYYGLGGLGYARPSQRTGCTYIQTFKCIVGHQPATDPRTGKCMSVSVTQATPLFFTALSSRVRLSDRALPRA